MLSGEAIAALVGAGLGWVLGFLTDLARGEWERRRHRKTAARLVYAELVVSMANVITLRDTGRWPTTELHRSAWETHGAALLHRASEDRLVRIARAYSALADVSYLAAHPDPQTAVTDVQGYLEESLEIINRGLEEVAALGGIRGAPDAVEQA